MPIPKSDRERFQFAIKGENSGRPPLWVMRQAGRYLPEYRALKEKYDFLTMVKTPELAVEVTMQPLVRFRLDAAILFSDILVIPEAMGQPYHFREKGGIEMQFALKNMSDLDRLSEVDIKNKLSYVADALNLLRTRLGNEKALLGFCGSPWTLACYMIDGGSSEGFPKTVGLAKEQPVFFASLMEKITIALIDYVAMQKDSGVDAIQIFDSWHSICPEEYAWDWSLKWINRILKEIPTKLPVILYAKTPENRLQLLAQTGVSGLSLDERHDLSNARKELPLPFALQGNLPPHLLETSPDNVIRETKSLLENMKSDAGHILNLGHGIRPQAKIECMEALIETNATFSSIQS